MRLLTIPILSISFVLTTSFCCCLERTAFAAPMPESCHESMSSGQSGHQAQCVVSENQHKLCDCHKIMMPLLQPSLDLANLKIKSYEGLSTSIITAKVHDLLDPKLFGNLLHGHPAKEYSSIPLYLKNSILRI